MYNGRNVIVICFRDLFLVSLELGAPGYSDSHFAGGVIHILEKPGIVKQYIRDARWSYHHKKMN